MFFVLQVSSALSEGLKAANSRIAQLVEMLGKEKSRFTNLLEMRNFVDRHRLTENVSPTAKTKRLSSAPSTPAASHYGVHKFLVNTGLPLASSASIAEDIARKSSEEWKSD